jgi:CAAX prenyl protease-like protein
MSQELALDSRHRASLARVLPFVLYIGFLAAMPLIADALPGFDRRWLYAVQIGAVAFVLAFFARHYVELRFVQPLSVNQWLAGLATGLAVFILWISLDLPWMKLGAGETAGFDPRDAAGAVIWPLALVRVLGAALVVPVMEELFWRSFVMRWIDNPKFLAVLPAAISLRALLLSSVVFGVEHDLWLAGIVAGLAYGWLYMRSGNLWSPILAHGLTNLLLGLWVLNTGNWQFW